MAWSLRPDPFSAHRASFEIRTYRLYMRAALPPLALDYARLDELNDELRTLDPRSLEGIPAGVDGKVAQWVDLDGEGIPGAMTSTGPVGP